MTSSSLEMIRSVGPRVAARSEEIERTRDLPPDIVAMIQPTDAFRMYVPADLGGPGLSAWESLEVLEELAFHDGASGWCAMIGSTTSLLSSFLPDSYARELFASRSAIGGGFAIPAGRAVPVKGGLRVTGRWAWGSGTRHCTTIGGGCVVTNEDGRPQARSDGLRAPFVFFSPEDVEFIDNWEVSGLCGTGSGDYQVTEVFVPEGRWAEIGSEPTRDNALSRFSFFGLLACGVASCALGIGRRSVHELAALAVDKRPQGSSRSLAQRSQIQAEVAAAEAKLAAAFAFIRNAVGDAWNIAETGSSPSPEQKRVLRLAATHATQTSAEVAEAMYKAGGGAAVYRTSPLQRTFRDAFVATQHAMVAPRTFETLGRLRLGLEADTKFL